MRTFFQARLLLGLIALALTSLWAMPASAQATRTWVSGVGDDVNPCSRTAPCKTFAGAISKTAAGGEINCLDPGGFGAVTITKAMTIDCNYTEGGVLVWGVFAPTRHLTRHALAGTYGGASAGAAIGVGVGANALLGGSHNTIALQPLSAEGSTGLSIALGVTALSLR